MEDPVRQERRWVRFRRLGVFVAFALCLLVLTVACTILWSATANEWLYDCTDDVGFDYLQPGNWVHGHLAVVPQIVHGRSMSEPDTIKAGWTICRLCWLWFSYVGASMAVSLAFAISVERLLPKPRGSMRVFAANIRAH